jgi:hypothetical protein
MKRENEIVAERRKKAITLKEDDLFFSGVRVAKRPMLSPANWLKPRKRRTTIACQEKAA